MHSTHPWVVEELKRVLNEWVVLEPKYVGKHFIQHFIVLLFYIYILKRVLCVDAVIKSALCKRISLLIGTLRCHQSKAFTRSLSPYSTLPEWIMVLCGMEATASWLARRWQVPF